ncbi:MAG: class I SAM-dependent methyltransferase [Candidatus Eiseniibacteriota bacterium]
MSSPRETTPEHWQRFWTDGRPLHEVYSNQGRLVEQALAQGSLSGRRILEVGAGTGRDTMELVRRGAIGYVLDYTFGSLELMQAHARHLGVPLTLVCADARALPFRDDSFALVFHQGLLEHFREPVPLLTENARVLEPGATLIVDVPQRYHLYTVAKKILIAMNRWFAGWETEFSPAELERLVRAEGLSVTRTYGDWMVPGLFYRAVRVTLAKAGIKALPMYPKGPAFWENFWNGLREWLRTQRWALYTTHVIGVVATKRGAAARPLPAGTQAAEARRTA